jgi:drug/metabolite transporter (DMT)-like permease
VAESSHGFEATKARITLVLLSLGWGVTWPIMRIALSEIPPFSMRVGSLFVGAVTLAVLARWQGHNLAIRSPKAWAHIFVASLLNIVSFSVLIPFAQLAAETSRVAILVYTMPIWAALLAWPILGERLTASRVAGLVLCIAGMVVLIAPLMAFGIPVGILLALAGGISWAAGTVYLKWAHIDCDPLAATTWQLVFGFLVVIVCVPIFEGSLHLWPVSMQAFLAIVFIGFVGSGLAFFVWFEIVRRLPAMTASLGVLSVPVVGVVSSMLMLGEQPTIADVVGFSLMLAASACVLLRPQEPLSV